MCLDHFVDALNVFDNLKKELKTFSKQKSTLLTIFRVIRGTCLIFTYSLTCSNLLTVSTGVKKSSHAFLKIGDGSAGINNVISVVSQFSRMS